MARLNRNVSFRKPDRPRAPIPVSDQSQVVEGDVANRYSPGDSALVYSFQIPFLDAQIDLAAERLKKVCVDISDRRDIQGKVLELMMEEAVENGLSIEEFFDQKEFTMTPDLAKVNELQLLAFEDDSVETAINALPVTVTLLFMKNAPTQVCGDFIVKHNARLTTNVRSLVEEIGSSVTTDGGIKADDEGEIEQLNLRLAITAILLMWAIESTLLIVIRQFLIYVNFWPLKGFYRLLRNLMISLIRSVSAKIVERVLNHGNAIDEEDQPLKSAQLRQIIMIAGNNPVLDITNPIGLT
jgi:hypothetical protein